MRHLIHPRRLMQALWAAIVLLVTFGLVGCGLGSAAEAPPDPVAAQRHELRAFLYTHSSAKVEYWPQWSAVPAEVQNLSDRFGTLPVAYNDVQVGLFRLTYTSNTLPQFTLHLKRQGNLKLLVYNHGHGGLPADFEAAAIEFLRAALFGGYDILVTSMPLVGLNTVRSATAYTIATRGRTEQAVVANDLLYQHALYEVIEDPDHYMHYFIDGAVIAASASARHLERAESIGYVREPLAQAFPGYTEVNYVGLSGGATVGVTACAVHRFDRCILIAGVMPNYLRVAALNNWGDTEQISRSFYDRFDVQRLMDMARGNSGKLVFVYNRHDPCCFADPAASAFQRDFPGYDIRITELQYHGYVASDLLSMLRE